MLLKSVNLHYHRFSGLTTLSPKFSTPYTEPHTQNLEGMLLQSVNQHYYRLSGLTTLNPLNPQPQILNPHPKTWKECCSRASISTTTDSRG